MFREIMFSGANGHRLNKVHVSCLADDDEQDWQPYRLIPTLLNVMTIYIYTYIQT